MKIKSPFSDELKFEEYFKMRSKTSDYDLATSMRNKKMSDEEIDIYKKRYEEFRKKYSLLNSKGGAGMIIKSDNQISTPYKLYMDPGLDTLDFAELIMDECNKRGFDYSIKLMTPEELKIRGEKLILYGASAKDISELYDMLNELIEENDSIKFGKPPIFADNIDGKIGFGYDDFEANMSYNNWMSRTIKKAGSKFAEIITSEVPEEYISTFSHKARLKDSLRDFPKLREKFRLYLNEEYMNAIKDIPEIEQFMTLDDNNGHQLDKTDEKKITETKSLDNSTEQLPEGAEWKLNTSGDKVIIRFKDGAKMTYAAEVASKKFGIKIPNQEQTTNKLPEGAEWKLYQNGQYRLLIKEKDGSRVYSVEQAIRTYGVNPPNYKKTQIESKLPIASNPKNQTKNIASTELSRNVQRTSTEVKEVYKEVKTPTHTIEEDNNHNH